MEEEIKNEGAEQNQTSTKSEQTAKYPVNYQYLYERSRQHEIFLLRMLAEQEQEPMAIFYVILGAALALLFVWCWNLYFS